MAMQSCSYTTHFSVARYLLYVTVLKHEIIPCYLESVIFANLRKITRYQTHGTIDTQNTCVKSRVTDHAIWNK